MSLENDNPLLNAIISAETARTLFGDKSQHVGREYLDVVEIVGKLNPSDDEFSALYQQGKRLANENIVIIRRQHE